MLQSSSFPNEKSDNKVHVYYPTYLLTVLLLAERENNKEPSQIPNSSTTQKSCMFCSLVVVVARSGNHHSICTYHAGVTLEGIP